MKYFKIYVSYSAMQIIVIIILSTFWATSYGTSDDWILDSWLNSNYTGEFEKESVFVTAIFSISISYLYSLKLGIAWYSIILMSLSFYSIIHWLTISTQNNILRKKYIPIFINFCAATIFLIWIYFEITFTSTAIICALVGLSSLIMAQINMHNTKINMYSGYSLILIAYIIRPESLIPVIVLFTPLIIYLAKRTKKISIRKVFYLTPILILSITIILNKYLENNQSKEMQQYRTFVYNVQLFSDRPRLVNILNELDRAKWSANEYHMFSDMIYFDKNIFNNRWLQDGIVATNYNYQSIIQGLQDFKYIWGKYSLNTQYLFPTFLGAIIYTLFLYKRKWQKSWILFIFSTIAIVIGIHLYMGIFLHNVPRVSIPLLFGLLITLNSNWQDLSINREYNRFKSIFLFLYCVCILITINNLNNYKNISNKKITNSIATSNAIEKEYPKKVILIPGRLEFNQMRNPYLYLDYDPNPNVMTIGNWDTFSPQWNKRLLNLNLDSENLADNILRESNILWSSTDYPDIKSHILDFYNEHGYGIYKFNKIGTLPNETFLHYIDKLK